MTTLIPVSEGAKIVTRITTDGLGISSLTDALTKGSEVEGSFFHANQVCRGLHEAGPCSQSQPPFGQHTGLGVSQQ
jgi:hypothetical protein